MTADRAARGTLGPATWALALAIAGAFCVLIALGVWQLQRLEWKEGLIAAAAERPAMAAVAAPGPQSWPLDMATWNYRRVRLTGTFGVDEVYVWFALGDPKGPLGGPGYFVLAPFTTEDGWHAVVNRGFVPDAMKAPHVRPQSRAPTGPVTLEGIVRRDDPPNFVTPAPDTEDKIWFSRDVAAMAGEFGLPAARTAPYNIDLIAQETPAGGLPQAGESRVHFSNNHLQYALTWFALAGCLVVVCAAAVWRTCNATREAADDTAP